MVVVVERRLLESRAYNELDGKASKVLMWFLAKRQFARLKGNSRQEWMQTNNGELTFTYEEAKKKHGYSGQVFSRLLEDLVLKGFIEIAKPGTGVGKVASKYAISRRWEKYGTAEFIEVERVKRTSHKFPKGKDHPIHKGQQRDKLLNRTIAYHT
ncbi:hypothetical protein ACFL6E_05150 [Candidatus Neomarinimicrobiota bacterium]